MTKNPKASAGKRRETMLIGQEGKCVVSGADAALRVHTYGLRGSRLFTTPSF